MTRRPSLLGFGALLLVAAAVLVVVLATGSGTSSSEDVDTSIVAPAGANLIVNGSAQVGASSVQGWDAVTIPGWRVLSGLPTVVGSGTRGFPAVPGSTGARVPSTGAREDASAAGAAGARLFVGGAGGTARLTQLIPLLSADRRTLPAGTSYQLSASLAGTATSSASLELALLSGSGRVLGVRKLGPAGEDALQGATRAGGVPALSAHLAGALPAGTVAARVTLVLSTSLRNVDGPDAPLVGYNRAVATGLQLSLAAPTRQLPLTPPAGHVPRYEHVFLFYFENQDYRAIIGNIKQAPFINSLLPHASLLANLYAEEHPSDGNYLALEGGSTFGVPLNDPLEEDNLYTIHARELGSELDRAGVSWAYYLQGAEGPCDDTVHDYYWDDDLMPMYFASIRDRPAYCAAHVLPLERTVPDLVLTQTTPSFAWIGADDCDDMEGCGIRAGDSFLAQQLGAIMRSPAWRTQRSLAIISFDEDAYDNERPAQRVATIVIGSSGVRAGYVSHVRYTHYSLLRTIEAALGLSTLTANDRWAQPLNDVFSAGADDGWLPPAASHATTPTPAPTTTPIQVPDGTNAEIAHARAVHAAWLAEVARSRSAPQGAPTAFVVNSGAGTVTPIDLLTGRARRSIAVGADPQAIAITPDGRMALVVNAGSSSVTPIDTVSLKAGPPITVGLGPARDRDHTRRPHGARGQQRLRHRHPDRSRHLERARADHCGRAAPRDRDLARWPQRICARLGQRLGHPDRYQHRLPGSADHDRRLPRRGRVLPRRRDGLRRRLRLGHGHADRCRHRRAEGGDPHGRRARRSRAVARRLDALRSQRRHRQPHADRYRHTPRRHADPRGLLAGRAHDHGLRSRLGSEHDSRHADADRGDADGGSPRSDRRRALDLARRLHLPDRARACARWPDGRRRRHGLRAGDRRRPAHAAILAADQHGRESGGGRDQPLRGPKGPGTVSRLARDPRVRRGRASRGKSDRCARI